MKLKFTNILPLLLSLLACSSCVYDKYGVCPGEDIEMPGEEQYVNLDLRIAINDGEAPGSRAFDTDDDGTFEEAVPPYELVHTLRVVIVRENGTTEHNRMVTVREDYGETIQSGDIVNDNLQFKVVAGEKKTIYLFANEKAVNNNKAESEIFDFSGRLKIGKPFPADDVAGILIKRKQGEAFIDNSGNGYKTYVPMSECFDVKIEPFDSIAPKKSGVAEKFLQEELFLTRSLIKFSFSVNLDVNGSDTQMKLAGVKIANLADYGYYLPNKAVYKPDKYSPSDNDLGGRLIESFNVPWELTPTLPDDLYSDCTFMFDKPLPLTKTGKNEVSPLIYLPESKLLKEYKKYTFQKDSETPYYLLSLLFSDPIQDECYESKPLKLTIDNITTYTNAIARNTHVKVNIVIRTYDISATVTLFPYTAVSLIPSFGF